MRRLPPGAILRSLVLLSFGFTSAAVVLGLQVDEPFTAAFALAAFAYGLVGALIVSRRPDNGIGWMFIFIGLVVPMSGAGEGYFKIGQLPGREWVAWAASLSFPFTFGSILILLPLTFPNGSFLSRRWRWIGIIGGIEVAFATIAFALGPGRLDCCNIENPAAIDALKGLTEGFLSFGFLGMALIAVVAFASVIVRFRRSRGEERLQMKWFTFAAGFMTLAALMGGIAGLLDLTGNDIIPIIVFPAAILSLPVATGIAILKYRLYEIDVVINKTVVYGGLAAFITAVYVGVVVGIGSLVEAGDKPNLGLSLAATAIVAVAFQPVRERVQRFANKLVYGERVTPYEAITGFSHRMAESLSLDSVLPQMAEAAAKGVGGVRSRVKLSLPGGGEQVVTWPDGSTEDSFDRNVAVVHQGEEMGEISVSKAPGEQINSSEEKLLTDLASQAGLAMRNLRLTAELQQKLVELQASRQRIVKAQDEERRRMERDIHDGAQQQLVSMSVKLGLAKNLLRSDPVKAGSLLEELGHNAGETVESLRDLARGLFPQVLVDRGLVAALDGHASKMGLDVAIDDGLGDARFDLEVEANVYFCIREALQNASKHALGSPITIRLWSEDRRLSFSVKDAGPGFDPEKVRKGSGLQNMKDRVEALGGTLSINSRAGRGTNVNGLIPTNAIEVAR